jgi:hypothetical protein
VIHRGQVGPLPLQIPSLLADEANNGEEMEDSENLSKVWETALEALEVFDDTVNEASTRGEAIEDYWAVNSAGGDVAEGRPSQTTPSTTPISAVSRPTTLNAPASVSSLQRMSGSGPEGEVDNARDKDLGLEG